MEPTVQVSPTVVTLDVVQETAAVAAVAAVAPPVPAVAAAVAVPVPAAVAVPVPVVAVADPKQITAVVDALTADEKFLAKVKASVDKILKDGKVDQSDIPELVFIISETVNTLGSHDLTVDMVPLVIKMVYKFIVDKYNLVPEEKKADFERIVDSSLRLLMFQPNVRKGLNNCFAFLTCSK